MGLRLGKRYKQHSGRVGQQSTKIKRCGGGGKRESDLEDEGLGRCIIAIAMLLGQLFLNYNGWQIGGSRRGCRCCCCGGGSCSPGGRCGWWRRQIGRSWRGCRCRGGCGGRGWWWRRQIGGHGCWCTCGGGCRCCCGRCGWWRWQIGGHW